jgi:hypothetical protein
VAIHVHLRRVSGTPTRPYDILIAVQARRRDATMAASNSNRSDACRGCRSSAGHPEPLAAQSGTVATLPSVRRCGECASKPCGSARSRSVDAIQSRARRRPAVRCHRHVGLRQPRRGIRGASGGARHPDRGQSLLSRSCRSARAHRGGRDTGRHGQGASSEAPSLDRFAFLAMTESAAERADR